MKPDYKNWVPRGLLFLLGGITIICLALSAVFGIAGVATEGGLRIALGVLFGAAFLLVAVLTGIFANMYCAFSYNGKRKISKRVIEGIAKYVTLPDGGRGLDVGCGSGAMFDAVTSNYVYHNIKGKDKQQLLLETLRVLKKGGTFAIHDIMSPREYGDMRTFVKKLKECGYEKVELVDTTDGLFLTKKESRAYMLAHSKLLVGKK